MSLILITLVNLGFRMGHADLVSLINAYGDFTQTCGELF